MFRIISLLLAMVLIMANGAISYTPYPSRAAYLPGVNYLLLSEPDNLIGVNPGAETGDLTGWTGATVTATDAYSGTYKFEIAGGGGGMESDTGNYFNLNRGQRYKIIIPMKIASGTGSSPTITIKDENYLPVSTNAGIAGYLTTSWKLLAINFISPQNYANCKIAIVNNGIANIYVDDISITPEYLDMGLDSFSIDLLHQPLTQSGVRSLVKKRGDAAGVAGYNLYYNGTDKKYYFYISDGTVNLLPYSAAVSAIANQEYHWVRVTIDRINNLLKFYVNGVQTGADWDISTLTGNISTQYELRLYGYDAVNFLAKTYCDFIRFQRGTLRSDAWMAEEWARIQAGRIRKKSSATAMWDFDDSMVDSSQELMLQENTGTLTYADGWPYCVSPISYTFAVNHRYERRMMPLGGDSVVRSYRTGAAYLTPAPRKDSWELPFVGIAEAQYSAFLAAYEGGEPIDLWLDADEEKTGQFYFAPDSPPEMEGIPYFRSGAGVFNTTLYLVET